MRIERIEGRLHARLVAALRPKGEAGGARRFERVDHVQIVSPRLSPIFPGMHGRIGADETLFPTRWGTLAVVALQGLLIIRALVAEKLAKIGDAGTVQDQPIPEIVANLVTEMPQKGAVWFLLQRALCLAMHIVRLGDIDGDQSIVMTCEYTLGIPGTRILQELEREARAGDTVLRFDRQP